MSQHANNHSVLLRALWAIAVVVCIVGGLAAQALLAPLGEGDGWGTYEIVGFVAAGVVVLVGLLTRSRTDA